MSLRLGVRLVALLLPVAALLPAAAHAERVVTADPVGDAVDIGGESTDLADAVPAPDHAGADIVGTVVAHGANRLRIVVRFRAMERDPFHFTAIRVITPQGGYDLLVERLGGAPIASLDRGGRTIDCGGLKAKVDLRADTVTTSLPTSCLGAPRWVRLGVGAVAVSAADGMPEAIAAYADDAHREGAVRDTLAKGPKVRRG